MVRVGRGRLETVGRLIPVSLNPCPSLFVFLLPLPSLQRELEESASVHFSAPRLRIGEKEHGLMEESRRRWAPGMPSWGLPLSPSHEVPWALMTQSDTGVNQVIRTPGQEHDGRWRGHMGKGTARPSRRQTLLAVKRTGVKSGPASRPDCSRAMSTGVASVSGSPQCSYSAACEPKPPMCSGGFSCHSHPCLAWTEQEGWCGEAHPRVAHASPTCPQPGHALLSLRPSLVHLLGTNPSSSMTDHSLSELTLHGVKEMLNTSLLSRNIRCQYSEAPSPDLSLSSAGRREPHAD